MMNHPLGNLMILLVLAGCGSMQRWSQNDLQSASVAHSEAIRYANMVDDCEAPEIAKSQDAIVRMEASTETRPWHGGQRHRGHR